MPETPLDIDGARRAHLDGARQISGPGEPVARAQDVQIPGPAGNLAAVLAHRARDHRHPHVAFQLLIYPVLDPARDTASYRELGAEFGLTSEVMAWYWDCYLDDADPTRPEVNPGLGELDDLPP